MDLPSRWGWLTSRRFVRAASAVVALVALALVLYNATAVDRVPPTVTIRVSSIAAGGNLALTLTSIDVDFSEGVKRPSAEGAFSIWQEATGSPKVPGSIHWQGDRTLIFTPSDKLPLSATFHVHLGPGVQDQAGNTQGGASDLTFTTVGPPVVKTVTPARDAQSVPVDSTIVVAFDRLMDPDQVLAGLRLQPAATFKAAWKGPVLTITPDKQLQYATTYTLAVSDTAVDTDGTPLTPFQTTFTTVGIGLRASSLIPANVAGVSVRTPIAVVFDGPIDQESIANALQITPPVEGTLRIETLPDDRNPIGAASPAPGTGGNVLVFVPSQPLAVHTTYTVALKPSVRRTDGEVAAAQTWTFTTGEPPTTAQNQIAFLSDRGGVTNVWLMNPDGTNQREVTAELVPVSGFDISQDGTKIAYGAGGVVKRMSLAGGDLITVTAGNRFEYAPIFTPDATAIVVGRRDAGGVDQGYWRIPVVTGADEHQLVPTGAPGLGSVALGGDGLTDSPGQPSWAPRAAFSSDGKTMLLVRGDDTVELVDMTGAAQPVTLGIVARAGPVWVAPDSSFFIVASTDSGATWGYARVSVTGEITTVGSAVGQVAATGDGTIALLLPQSDGSTRLGFASAASSSTPVALTKDSSWSERSPSFSPDGSQIVFGRVSVQSPTSSAGIWTIGTDGTGLRNLAIDGAYPRWMP